MRERCAVVVQRRGGVDGDGGELAPTAPGRGMQQPAHRDLTALGMEVADEQLHLQPPR